MQNVSFAMSAWARFLPSQCRVDVGGQPCRARSTKAEKIEQLRVEATKRQIQAPGPVACTSAAAPGWPRCSHGGIFEIKGLTGNFYKEF